MQRWPNASSPKRWAERNHPAPGSSIPTSTQVTRRRLCKSKTRVFWRRTANTDRCSTSITSWSRITRAIKRRIRASQHFRYFWGAWHTIAGYEAVRMIRKGQACWSAIGTGPVCCTASFLVCFESRSNSFSYRTHLPFESKVATLRETGRSRSNPSTKYHLGLGHSLGWVMFSGLSISSNFSLESQPFSRTRS